jgi:hypothetical protein
MQRLLFGERKAYFPASWVRQGVFFTTGHDLR